jgi:hypothetical protein
MRHEESIATFRHQRLRYLNRAQTIAVGLDHAGAARCVKPCSQAAIILAYSPKIDGKDRTRRCRIQRYCPMLKGDLVHTPDPRTSIAFNVQLRLRLYNIYQTHDPFEKAVLSRRSWPYWLRKDRISHGNSSATFQRPTRGEDRGHFLPCLTQLQAEPSCKPHICPETKNPAARAGFL